MQEEINRNRLLDQLYNAIKSRVIELRFELGSRIDIKRLATEFGVSDSPVRVALNRLTHEGLVNMIPRKGYFIVDLTPLEIEETYDARTALESHAIRNGIISQIKKDTFKSVKDQLTNLVTTPNRLEIVQLSLKADKTLHHEIMSMSCNKIIQRFYSEIDALTQLILTMFRTINENEVIQEHLKLLEAILEGDKEQAVACLTKHLENGKRRNIEEFTRKTKLKSEH